MGNLMSNYSDEECREQNAKYVSDIKNGMPACDDILLKISVYNKPLSELESIRTSLSQFYDDYELALLDKWIKWKKFEIERDGK